MKKKALLLGVAALGVLALASCGEETDDGGSTSPELPGRTINCYVNYKGAYGVTFTGKNGLGTSYKNPIDNQTYVPGNLLPMWKQVQENLDVTIHDSVVDVDNYVSGDDATQLTKLEGYADFNKLDFVMMSNANANSFSSQGKLLNINKYLQYMPNYKAFLDKNATIKNEMTNADGEMFMLPYFDGLNTAEHMFIMNTELVEKLLDDANPAYDEVAIAAEKTNQYQATIKTDVAYKVGISVNGKLQDLNVKASKNPVTRQNELTTKNGKTYAEALKEHLTAAYGPFDGTGTYEKMSEVFTSESACYTTDDLIALLRVAVNNSNYLGYKDKLYGFIPRQAEKSRIDSVLWLMQIWGIQGIRGTAEKDALYFDKDGKLQDGRVQEASYDGLTKLHQLYAEGLILPSFETEAKTKYASIYFTGKEGAALLTFDYNTTQTANNATDENGNGTKGSKFNKLMPILSPLTTWENNTDKTYAYSRYIESSRANKGSGTVIPKHKNENDNIAACKFADYFFSEEGADLQDFGPAAFRDGDKTVTVAGVAYPKYNQKIITEALNPDAGNLGWNNYCRGAIGTTQGIGHVRQSGVEYQFMHVSGRQGQTNLESAIAAGAQLTARSDRAAGFGAAVPSQWSSEPQDASSIQSLVDFWARGVGDANWRAVVIHGWDGATGVDRETLKGLFETSNKVYLEHYRNLLTISGK